jgi:hypothetical protein
MKFNWYWTNEWRLNGVFHVLPSVVIMYDDYPPSNARSQETEYTRQSARRMWTVQVSFLTESASVDILVGKNRSVDWFV